MSRTVYKYELRPGYEERITGGTPRVVHVGIDPKLSDLTPCAWVELDPDGSDVLIVTFIGTGHPVPPEMRHVGSCMAAGGHLFWHAYAKPEGYWKFPE